MINYQSIALGYRLICLSAFLLIPSLSLAAILIEEVTVTAQKREQSLQDVGISVTAFSGDQIRALGYTNTIDLAQQTPSLRVQQIHPHLTSLNIRGISQNDFSSHLEAPVAVYIDDAYVSSMSGVHAQTFDLARVEVLRGRKVHCLVGMRLAVFCTLSVPDPLKNLKVMANSPTDPMITSSLKAL